MRKEELETWMLVGENRKRNMTHYIKLKAFTNPLNRRSEALSVTK